MKDNLLATACQFPFNEGAHRLVKRGYMCQHCEALSDCPTTLSQELCPRKLDLEPETSPPQTKAETQSPVVEQPPPKPAAVEQPPPKRIKADLANELGAQEARMTKLLLLKGLHEERLRLQKLVALRDASKTGQASSKAAVFDIIRAFMCAMSQQNKRHLKCYVRLSSAASAEGIDNVETQPMVPEEAQAYMDLHTSSRSQEPVEKSQVFHASSQLEDSKGHGLVRHKAHWRSNEWLSMKKLVKLCVVLCV